MQVEILTDASMVRRGAQMLEAMIEAAPVPVKVRQQYQGDCDVLMVYGMGHPARRQWWAQHRARGGRCIGWDLGYWKHDEGSMRVTIDSAHPHQWIRPEPADRWEAEGIDLREVANPRGHALIVGLGLKSVKALGLRHMEWERGAAKRAKAMGLMPVHKPKKAGEIDRALKGAALVMCRHSNVAVDACIAGVPVICEDGAALALYQHGTTPTREQRLEFLRSLAWWNWRPNEAGEAWKYLIGRLG